MSINQNVQLMTVRQECKVSTAQAMRLLAEAGLRIVRSFDLHSARAVHSGCTCPHHGTHQCTCQMVVLLVYGANGAPVTLVVHGHDKQTWFSLVDIPQQPADPQVRNMIAQALVPDNFIAMSHDLLIDVA